MEFGEVLVPTRDLFLCSVDAVLYRNEKRHLGIKNEECITKVF